MYYRTFRLQTYIATQFKPVVATIYQMTNAKRVLDTSCNQKLIDLKLFLLVTLKNTINRS